MRNALMFLAVVLGLSLIPSVAWTQQAPGAKKTMESAVPRKGTTRLTNAAYRKILDFLEACRRTDPQSEWVAALSWTDIQVASREAAERGEWSKPIRTWSLGGDRRGRLPDDYFETIRGVRILIIYNVEPWRRLGRRLIDYRDGRFVTIEPIRRAAE